MREYQTLVDQWELLESVDASLTTKLKELESQEAALEWWNNGGKEKSEASNKTNKYATAMSQYGQLTQADLLGLQGTHFGATDAETAAQRQKVLTEYQKGE
jgi:hypothetical protein